MVTTRSGRNTAKNTTTNNITQSVNTRKTRSSSKSKRQRQQSIENCVQDSNNVSYTIINHKNFGKRINTYYDYIYRTVNINDMSDFRKITKYGEQYPTMMYVIRNQDKSQIAYGTCETRYIEETFTSILANHHDVVSQVNLTMYVVFVNYSQVLDKLIHVMNYKLDMPYNQSTYFNEYFVLNESKFDKLIKVRDNTLKYIQCMKLKLQF